MGPDPALKKLYSLVKVSLLLFCVGLTGFKSAFMIFFFYKCFVNS